ncbi:MAG: DUF1553 domain-containing protein, partial [Planctomycetes bacterium]|nr:DUF1553 domain-containing protein [Planctomycetota bacterium]
SWPKNPIDNFVLVRLLREQLQPATETDRYTLVRRVYLDLIGLPPTPEEADAFVNDDHPNAYENLVDNLLKSKHYGERWARLWLDLARYADTNGYEKDRPRSIWPFRDWVIRALNDDMPFDQFTVEQLAGDMLPKATVQQRIATGFHRNTMSNDEGGTDNEEFRDLAIKDRVATTGQIWMGMSWGCAQCHSHKYDPISHTDYYRLLSLLNNADEPDLGVPNAAIAERRRAIEAQIEQLELQLPNHFPPAEGNQPIEERRRQNLDLRFSRWLNDRLKRAVTWHVLRPHHLSSNLPKLEALKDGSVFSSGDITKRDVYKLRFRLDQFEKIALPITALRLEVLPDERLPAGGPGRAYYEGRKGDFFLSELRISLDGQPIALKNPSHSFGKISIGSGKANAENVIDKDGSTGWSTSGREGQRNALVLNLARPLLNRGELEIEMVFERHFAASLGRFRFSVAFGRDDVKANSLPERIEKLLSREPPLWKGKRAQAELRRYFLSITPELADARVRIDQLRNTLPALPTTMVMKERAQDNPRKSFRHHRGEYLSPREEVAPGIPTVFSPLTADPPTNRLEFARWLVSDGNPLVARVTVNRAWRAFFGHGIVRTSGDFGTQSDPPTHPRLLDWLAREFAANRWSLKHLHRTIVTSATYRQSSRMTAELLKRDPANRLLARGPRHRVDAEMVRDICLTASGLLSPKIGGPSVYPPQPRTVTELAYGRFPWNASSGADRYRRSLYTFSKRTAPFAAHSVYDAPTGENCVPRRNRSNTPLQALTLLNDEMFLEMARAVARQAVTSKVQEPAGRATFIFRRFLTRPPARRELAALVKFQQAQLKRVKKRELSAGEIAADEAATAELASWVMVARAIMNLDETITKE